MRWITRIRRRRAAAQVEPRPAEVVEAARRMAILERRLVVLTGGANGGPNDTRKRS